MFNLSLYICSPSPALRLFWLESRPTYSRLGAAFTLLLSLLYFLEMAAKMLWICFGIKFVNSFIDRIICQAIPPHVLLTKESFKIPPHHSPRILTIVRRPWLISNIDKRRLGIATNRKCLHQCIHQDRSAFNQYSIRVPTVFKDIHPIR